MGSIVTASSTLLDYHVPHLAREVERLSEGQIDALPFGAIRLTAEGEVEYYSAAERRLSGSGERQRVGLHFFDQVAPCMDNEHYRGRIQQAVATGTLDLEFSHIGDFADSERELTVRIQSSSTGGYWIFMRREHEQAENHR
jgi:photoactive yellow protein